MSRVRRFEKADSTLKPPQRLDSGFLRVDGRIARVGIQVYYNSQGVARRELRLPEEVFNADSLASFAQLPVTNTHPPSMLTSRDAKQYAVGAVGENVRQDGDYVAATMVLFDAEAIAAAESGRSQLSNGYSCVLDETQDPKLTEKWGAYDAIQRDIRGNHVALVDVARAGPEARLRLDAGDAATAEFGTGRPDVVGSKPEERESAHMPHKFKLDGLEVEVADANAQAIIERSIQAARKASEAETLQEKSRADQAEKAKGEATAQLSTLQAKYDALTEKVKADEAKMVKCDMCDGSGKCDNCGGGGQMKMDRYLDPKRRADEVKVLVAKGVKARAALLVEARRHLGANEKLDELDDIEIKKLVVKKLKPTANLDGKNEIYIEARYDDAVEGAKGPRSIDLARTVSTPAPAPARTDDAPASDPDEARRRMIARNHDALVKRN